MAAEGKVLRVWIEPGCVACGLCEDLVPEAFELARGASARVRSGWERRLEALLDARERMIGARDSCPIEIIRVELAPAPGISSQPHGRRAAG